MARGVNSCLPYSEAWEDTGPDRREICFHVARAALSAISAAGWRVVPVKRTPEMIQAGEGWASVQSAWEEMLIAAPKVTP